MRRRELLALAASAGATALARAARADPPATLDLLPPGDATVFTLDNGLTVALQVDRSSSLAAMQLQYAVGAGDDPEGYRGLAHLAEHLTYGATRHVPETLGEAIDALGATSHNGVTSVDHTRYYATVSAESLERALYFEAERMAFGLDAITPAWLAHEQAIVCTEHADRRGDDPTGSLFDVVQASLYPAGHRYHAWGDVPADVRAVTADGARWFVQRWYVPSCATLAVVGNLDVARTRAFIERQFGPIPLRPRPDPTRRAPAARLARPGVVTFEAPVRGERVELRWLTPARGSQEDAALDVAATVLYDRLRAALVRDRRHAYAVGAWQHSLPETSVFSVTARAETGVDVGAARDAALGVLERTRAQALPEEEFVRARAGQEALALARAATVEARAEAAVSEPDAADLGRHRRNLARYASLAPADVTRALREHLAPERGLAVEVRTNRRAARNGEVVSRRAHR